MTAIDQSIIDMMWAWTEEKYDTFLEFIAANGKNCFRKTLPEYFWKLSSNPLTVFRAIHPGEIKEGPKKGVSSWTISERFAETVSSYRGDVDVFSMTLKQDDVIIMPFSILDMKGPHYTNLEAREYEIIVGDYSGYELEKVS